VITKSTRPAKNTVKKTRKTYGGGGERKVSKQTCPEGKPYKVVGLERVSGIKKKGIMGPGQKMPRQLQRDYQEAQT